MTDYTLKLSDFERMRFRMMAARALENESDLWERAGIAKGARVVDLGCGPGAVLLELARIVGPDGVVVGVDQDPEARETATAWAAQEGLAHVEIREGLATDSDLPAGEWDAVMLRHVLIHNGPRVNAILAHVRGLLRPGGHVVLNETDASCIRYERDLDPDLRDMEDRYWQMLERGGNDIGIGPRLGAHAEDAGYEVVERRGRYDHIPMLPTVRPPSWAGRQAILDAGLCTEGDIARWDPALSRREAAGGGGFVLVPNFTVVARRP
ncbi:MAG: methyltransferase domain-containing protein [Actinomycetota bacterium]|nr:methyltransferase domain-containing protein [Actinomycetota bacterium]